MIIIYYYYYYGNLLYGRLILTIMFLDLSITMLKTREALARYHPPLSVYKPGTQGPEADLPMATQPVGGRVRTWAQAPGSAKCSALWLGVQSAMVFHFKSRMNMSNVMGP